MYELISSTLVYSPNKHIGTYKNFIDYFVYKRVLFPNRKKERKQNNPQKKKKINWKENKICEYEN